MLLLSSEYIFYLFEPVVWCTVAWHDTACYPQVIQAAGNTFMLRQSKGLALTHAGLASDAGGFRQRGQREGYSGGMEVKEWEEKPLPLKMMTGQCINKSQIFVGFSSLHVKYNGTSRFLSSAVMTHIQYMSTWNRTKLRGRKRDKASGGEGVRQSKVFQVFVPPQFTCLMKLSMS